MLVKELLKIEAKKKLICFQDWKFIYRLMSQLAHLNFPLLEANSKIHQMRFFYDPQLRAFRHHCESQEPSLFASEQHFRSRNQFAIWIKPNDSRQLYLISLVILNEHSGGPLRPNQSRSLKRSFRNWLRLGRVWPWLVIELNLWDWREWSKFFHSTPAISTKCKELNNYVDIKFHLFQFILIGKKKIQIKQKNKNCFILGNKSK
jgi:hypothetical protein